MMHYYHFGIHLVSLKILLFCLLEGIKILGKEFFKRLILKKNIPYCLSLKAASTLWNKYPDNGNLTLHIQFASQALSTTCVVSGTPECEDDNLCFQFPISLVYPSLHEIENFIFELDYAATGIYIWASTDNSCSGDIDDTCIDSFYQPVDGILLDDVSLTCTIPGVTGIEVKQTHRCEYEFSLETTEDFSASSIKWFLGEGLTFESDEKIQVKEFQEEGIYDIIVLIRDENGCCKLLKTTVTCGEVVCDYHICWSENFVPAGMPFNQTIQSLERLEGYTVINNQGVEEKISLFSSPGIDPGGNYEYIFDVFAESLESNFGVAIADIHSLHPNLDCAKGTQQMPGFYVENSPVPIVNFYGHKYGYQNFDLEEHKTPFQVICE